MNSVLAAVNGQLGPFASQNDIEKALLTQFQASPNNVNGATSQQLADQAVQIAQANLQAEITAQSQNAAINANQRLQSPIAANDINQGALNAANQQADNFNIALVNQGVLQSSLQSELLTAGVKVLRILPRQLRKIWRNKQAFPRKLMRNSPKRIKQRKYFCRGGVSCGSSGYPN